MNPTAAPVEAHLADPDLAGRDSALMATGEALHPVSVQRLANHAFPHVLLENVAKGRRHGSSVIS